MTQEFDKDYWESHWQQADGPSGRAVARTLISHARPAA